MSAAQAAVPHHPRPFGGSASKRIVVGYGFWIFLLSDIIMFSAFFATYAVLEGATAGGPDGHALFDLVGAIRRQLKGAGVPAAQVYDLGIDTRTSTGDFFSDRAARPCGRFAAIVRI